MSSAGRAIARGVTALLKCAVVIAGVPVALVRLSTSTALPHPLWSTPALSTLSFWIHVLLVVATLIWFWASFSLARSLLLALVHPEASNSTTWSSRWAVAVVGLLVLASGSLFASVRSNPSRPSSQVVAAREATPSMRRDLDANTTSVRAGESLANISQRTLGQRDGWRAIGRTNLNVVMADGRRMVDASLLRPGWTVRLPASSNAGEHAIVSDSRSFDTIDELAVLGLGILTATGLARRSRALRRVARCLRLPNTTRTMSDRTSDLDALLRSFEHSSLLDWIDAANRLLSRGLQDRSLPPPQIALVRAGPDGIEFLLHEQLHDAPAPFRADADGRWWRLDATIGPRETARLAAGAGRYVPGLIPVGDDGHAAYLVAIGPGERLAIEGDPDAASRYLAALVLALRVLPWTSELEVGLIGLPAPSPRERSYHVEALTPAGLADFLAPRPNDGSERLGQAWRREPLLVIGAHVQLDEGTVQSASQRVAIIGMIEHATTTIEVTSDGVALLPFGLELRPGAPSSEQLEVIDALLIDCTSYAEARREHEHDNEPSTEGPTIVLLSGDVELYGAPNEVAPQDLRRAVELIAFLALHGYRATRSELARTLFSDRDETAHQLALEHLLDAARTLLGRDHDGHPRLRVTGDLAELDHSVRSDWHRTRRAIDQARRVEADVAIELLRGALEPVSCRPLEDALIGYHWIVADGVADEIHVGLIDAAHHLAALALAARDHQLARWAIEKGSLIEPASEVLVRDLMASCELAGDFDGAESAFRELESTLEELDGNEPSPETRSYYEQLVAARRDDSRR